MRRRAVCDLLRFHKWRTYHYPLHITATFSTKSFEVIIKSKWQINKTVQENNWVICGPICYTLLIIVVVIIIIISGSTVLVRTLATSSRRFLNLIRTLGRTLLDKWSAHCKGLYLHRTTQHRNTKTNIHASSVIWTHDPSNQEEDLRILHF
jgi:hypothetical protein